LHVKPWHRCLFTNRNGACQGPSVVAAQARDLVRNEGAHGEINSARHVCIDDELAQRRSIAQHVPLETRRLGCLTGEAAPAVADGRRGMRYVEHGWHRFRM